MKITELRPKPHVKQLQCDRCHRLTEEGDWEFKEFFSIEHTAGYSLVFGDGNLISIDLCQHCVKELLGPWLRLAIPAISDLESFDPERHGGEFPTDADSVAATTSSDKWKAASSTLTLTRREIMTLANFEHESGCTGDVQLLATETGIGTNTTLICTNNCRPEIDITDYAAW